MNTWFVKGPDFCLKSTAGVWSECSTRGALWQSAVYACWSAGSDWTLFTHHCKKEHTLVFSKYFLVHFPLYMDLFCSVTFPLNSAERTTVTSGPLLEAFCKQNGKAKIRKCFVNLEGLIISEIQILFHSSTHWKEITSRMAIPQSHLSEELSGMGLVLSLLCQSRQLDWYLYWISLLELLHICPEAKGFHTLAFNW